MKKFLVALAAVFTVGVAGFATKSEAAEYTVNNEFRLPAGAGSSQIAQPNLIILHETANPTATGRNEATYMNRNWMNAYTTHIVGDGGIVYNVGQDGYVSWGALNANPYAPVQIELQHTTNRDLFDKNYRAYIALTRDMAKKYNIPLTLDTGTSVWDKGVKSHNWVSNYVGGDHTDPYGYLAKMGVSKAKLASDLANGLGGTSTPAPSPAPSQPTNPLTAGSHYSVLNDGKGNYAHVDEFGQIGNKVKARGWHIANYQYEYTFIIDQRTGKELARVNAKGVARTDVNQAYKTSGNVGYDVTFNSAPFKGKRIIVMQRATNDPTGNTKGGFQDFYETRWYHDIK